MISKKQPNDLVNGYWNMTFYVSIKSKGQQKTYRQLSQSSMRMTLNNAFRHFSHFITSQYIATIQPQYGTGHKRRVFDNV